MELSRTNSLVAVPNGPNLHGPAVRPPEISGAAIDSDLRGVRAETARNVACAAS